MKDIIGGLWCSNTLAKTSSDLGISAQSSLLLWATCRSQNLCPYVNLYCVTKNMNSVGEFGDQDVACRHQDKPGFKFGSGTFQLCVFEQVFNLSQLQFFLYIKGELQLYLPQSCAEVLRFSGKDDYAPQGISDSHN